jgi:hypothetical protein
MNNWSNYGQGYSSATYYTNASRVYLSGVIRVDTGASNTPATRYPDVDVRLKIASPQYTEYSVLCVLPEGYRPTERKILATITHKRNDPKNPEEMGRIDILTDGSIVLVQGNTSFLSLDGLSFNI